MRFLKENYFLARLFEGCFFYFTLLLFLVFSYSSFFQAAFLSTLFFFHFVFYVACFSRARFGYISFFIAGLFFDLRLGNFLGFYGSLFLAVFFLCRVVGDFLRDHNASHLWFLNSSMLFIYLSLRAFTEGNIFDVPSFLYKFILGVIAYPFAMRFYYRVERWIGSRVKIYEL